MHSALQTPPLRRLTACHLSLTVYMPESPLKYNISSWAGSLSPFQGTMWRMPCRGNWSSARMS